MDSAADNKNTKPSRDMPITGAIGSQRPKLLKNRDKSSLVAQRIGIARPKQAELRAKSEESKCTASTTDRKNTSSSHEMPRIEAELPIYARFRAENGRSVVANPKTKRGEPRQPKLCRKNKGSVLVNPETNGINSRLDFPNTGAEGPKHAES